MFVDVTKSGQYALDPSPCSNTASSTVKKGCPITPITQPVVAKQASAMLLMVFMRSLVFRANMTSAFELLVIGKQIRFMIIRYTITVYASLELSFSVPPKEITSSHSDAISSVWKSALRFIFLVLLDFRSSPGQE